MEPFEDELNTLNQEVIEETNAGLAAVQLPELPDAETVSDVDDWLYNSDRSYIEQTPRLRSPKDK